MKFIVGGITSMEQSPSNKLNLSRFIKRRSKEHVDLEVKKKREIGAHVHNKKRNKVYIHSNN